MRDSYDVVVIGSGFGGSILACRLAQAGRSVCVLERGKRWAKQDFPRTLGQVAHAFWNHRDFGLLDYRVFRNIDVLQASGVGGGSLVYFNVHRRAKARIFENPRWPRNVKRESLDPFYDRAKAMLEAYPLTPPKGLPLPHRTRALLDGARAAGHAPELLDICVYTGPERNNPHSGLPQAGCVYCGNCMLGCHVHAKNTLDLNYLPVAEKNGAEIRPLHEVTMIEPAAEGYRIYFKRLDSVSSGAPEPGSLLGRKVVVAAGSLGSTELLLRCRDVHRTLPRISKALGSNFSGNGDSLIPATTGLPQVIDAAWGPSITAGFGYSDGEDELYIQDLGIPDPFFWTLQAALPDATRFHTVWRVLKEYLARMLGRTSRKTEGVDFQKLFQGGLLHALPYLGMGTDDADGTIRLVTDQLDVDWKRTSSRTMFARMERLLRSLSEAMHGRYKPSPLWDWPVRKLLTAHPLGGCTMSDREEDGVVDEFGQVWNYENLIVADGSIVPTALAINPSATICALAERTAEHLTSSD